LTDTLEVRADQVAEGLAGLIRRLNRADGVPFVYEALEVVAKLYRLDDAIIRLESSIGGGFYRLHRAPVDQEFAQKVPAGPRVLHGEPDVVPTHVAETVLDLCVLALRLCISRHSRHLDRQTGLLTEHSFDGHLEASCAQAARHGWLHTLVVLDLASSEGEPTVDDIRRFGRALRRSLRRGDVASRIEERRFAGLLTNADLDAVSPFLARVYRQLGSDRSTVRLSLGAATTPNETVDPVELRRIAVGRIQPGAPDHTGDGTDLSASLWEYLELELRLLPPVVHVARAGRESDRETISILTTGPSTSVEQAARRIVEAHGLDVDFEFEALHAPGEPEPVVSQPEPVVRQPEPVVSQPEPVVSQPEPAVAVERRQHLPTTSASAQQRIVYTSSVATGPGEYEVRLAHGDRSGTGRSSAGEVRGSVEATLQAVIALGIDVQVTLDSVAMAKGSPSPSPVRVVLSETEGDRHFVGIARGATDGEAASRATLGALDGLLDGVPGAQPR
jgi:GGDEF domain-containing protein